MKTDNYSIGITKWQLFWRKLWDASNISYIAFVLVYFALIKGMFFFWGNINDINYGLHTWVNWFILILVSVCFSMVTWILASNVIPDFIQYWFSGWKHCIKK